MQHHDLRWEIKKWCEPITTKQEGFDALQRLSERYRKFKMLKRWMEEMLLDLSGDDDEQHLISWLTNGITATRQRMIIMVQIMDMIMIDMGELDECEQAFITRIGGVVVKVDTHEK